MERGAANLPRQVGSATPSRPSTRLLQMAQARYQLLLKASRGVALSGLNPPA